MLKGHWLAMLFALLLISWMALLSRLKGSSDGNVLLLNKCVRCLGIYNQDEDWHTFACSLFMGTCVSRVQKSMQQSVPLAISLQAYIHGHINILK